MAAQAVALAEAVGFPFHVKKVIRSWPWRFLPARFRWGALHLLTSQSDPLSPPYPDLMITCGRRAVPLGLAVKKASGNRTFCVHIQNPRVPVNWFDRVIVMPHDQLKGPQTLEIPLAFHTLTPEKLHAEKAAFPQLGHLPSPRVAVLVGGDTNRKKMTGVVQNAVLASLKAMRDCQTGHIWIVMSRRTPKGLTEKIQRDFQCPGVTVCPFPAPTPNPYQAFLGWADVVCVTSDSVNMMSEACATNKPVYLIPLPGWQTPPIRFGQNLIDKGYARTFQGTLQPWTPPPVPSFAPVAQTIREAVIAHRDPL